MWGNAETVWGNAGTVWVNVETVWGNAETVWGSVACVGHRAPCILLTVPCALTDNMPGSVSQRIYCRVCVVFMKHLHRSRRHGRPSVWCRLAIRNATLIVNGVVYCVRQSWNMQSVCQHWYAEYIIYIAYSYSLPPPLFPPR